MIPVYAFGEELTYKTVTYGLKFRIWLNKFKIPTVFFWSCYGFAPYNDIDLTTVYGAPINFP